MDTGLLFRSSHQMCSVKKGVLRNFAKFTENTCDRVSFLIKVAGLGLLAIYCLSTSQTFCL